MKKLVVVANLMVMLLGVGGAGTAAADAIGPVCISVGPPLGPAAGATFKMYLTPLSQADGIFTINGWWAAQASTPLTNGPLISGTARVLSDHTNFAFTGGASGPTAGSGPTFFLAGSISNSTGTGSALCEVRSGTQCGPVGSTVPVTLLLGCP
jgi:hypothetical protein